MPLLPFNKSFDLLHPSYELSFILLFDVLMQESGKFFIYTPCIQEIIKAVLQLIIQFPVKNKQQVVVNILNLTILQTLS